MDRQEALKSWRERLSHYLIRCDNLWLRAADIQRRFALGSAEYAKFIDAEGILYWREIQEVGVPFPPFSEMVTVGGETDLRIFLSVGSVCHEQIMQVLQLSPEIRPPKQAHRILDFGVGCARTMRFFYRQLDQFECHGCDVDTQAIRYLRDEVSFIASVQSGNFPPLPYADGYFQSIYSVSVFTHFTLPAFDLWLCELARCLEIGGCLILTLHGSTAVKVLQTMRSPESINVSETDFAKEQLKLDTEGFFWVPQPASSPDIDGSQFGICFIDENRVREFVPPQFSVLDYRPGVISGWQDVLVLRRDN